MFMWLAIFNIWKWFPNILPYPHCRRQKRHWVANSNHPKKFWIVAHCIYLFRLRERRPIGTDQLMEQPVEQQRGKYISLDDVDGPNAQVCKRLLKWFQHNFNPAGKENHRKPHTHTQIGRFVIRGRPRFDECQKIPHGFVMVCLKNGILMDTPLNTLKWQAKKIPMMNHGGLDGFRGTQFSDSWTTRIFALAGARSSHCCLLSGSEPWRKASKAASKTCLWQLIWSWAVLLSSRLVFT